MRERTLIGSRRRRHLPATAARRRASDDSIFDAALVQVDLVAQPFVGGLAEKRIDCRKVERAVLFVHRPLDFLDGRHLHANEHAQAPAFGLDEDAHRSVGGDVVSLQMRCKR